MDAYFAAVEQRDNPELRDKAIAIGSPNRRGVVSTASYQARKFGVHSAMSSLKAQSLCPDLIFVEGNYQKYKEVSNQIHEIFHRYTDLIEPLSLDEAFLDVTENKINEQFAVNIAKRIKQEIKEELNLTASAGVSYNKFLAKIASDFQKPDGLTVVHPLKALDFIAKLDIEKFWGVGSVTAKKMHSLGIHNGAILREYSLNHLVHEFGKSGYMFYNFARGIDDRLVESYRERKSVGCEHTFMEDINNHIGITVELYNVVLELCQRLQKSQFEGNTLTLKIKFFDFNQITRSYTSKNILNKKEEILPIAKSLLQEIDYQNNPIRLIGLSISNPHIESLNKIDAVQLELWEDKKW